MFFGSSSARMDPGFAGWVPVMGTCVDPCYDAFETHQENADCARVKTERQNLGLGHLLGIG